MQGINYGFIALLLLNCWLQTGRVDNDNGSCFIDELKPGSELIIKFESNGCFHSNSSKITIKRTSDAYIAILDINRTNRFNGKRIGHRYKKKIALTPLKINAIREMEIALRRFEKDTSYNCTTTNSYELSYGIWIRKYTDDSCDWDGFNKLLKDLYRKQL